MKKIILILISIILITGCDNKSIKIDYKEAKELIDKGATIIDVRTELEYNQGHIEGAINVPYVEIEYIENDKNDNIIVYCRSGSRSKTAADILTGLGYKHIYDLGSKDNWKENLVK